MSAPIVEMLGLGILGLLAGSFLNVCIHRLPLEESVVFPRSHCPACGALIRWFDNVPVLSFLFLRGRCRSCSVRISWRYAAVELLTAGIFSLTYILFFNEGEPVNGLAYLYFFCVLLIVTFIDLEHFLILDVLTYPGMGICLLGALPGHVPLSSSAPMFRLLESAQGLVLGGGILWAIQFLGALWYRRQGLDAMGLGDVKLAAFTGAFLGPRYEAAALLMAVFLGGSIAILLILTGVKTRKDYIPFGPALALGAALAPFFGERLLGLYHF